MSFNISKKIDLSREKSFEKIMSYVDATGLSRGAVLAALYNNIKPQGNGIEQYMKNIMTPEEGEKVLLKKTNLDYLEGRPVKVNFEKFPELYVGLYDRDREREEDKARVCIEKLRKGEEVKAKKLTKKEIEEMKGNISSPQVKLLPEECPIHKYIGGETISNLPFTLEEFDKVWFNPLCCEQLQDKGVVYPTDWHVFEYQKDDKAHFISSGGTSFWISANDRAVIRVESSKGKGKFFYKN